jgi:hypothetical protein
MGQTYSDDTWDNATVRFGNVPTGPLHARVREICMAPGPDDFLRPAPANGPDKMIEAQQNLARTKTY